MKDGGSPRPLHIVVNATPHKAGESKTCRRVQDSKESARQDTSLRFTQEPAQGNNTLLSHFLKS